jgi:mono/diheme cytochrome c family protein
MKLLTQDGTVAKRLIGAAVIISVCALAIWGEEKPERVQFHSTSGSVTNNYEHHYLALLWDNVDKACQAKEGDTTASFGFSFTNASSSEVWITDVRTSCGCILVDPSPQPWQVEPGSIGEVKGKVDLRLKFGLLIKTLSVGYRVETDATPQVQTLTLRINVPSPKDWSGGKDERTENQNRAKVDRQSVFKGSCATCHLAAIGERKGEELYFFACRICHEPLHRASMVPDLKKLSEPTDREYWLKWVTYGREGSLMPAFAQTQGGPLTREQIDSLADYLVENFSPVQQSETPKAANDSSRRPIKTGQTTNDRKPD